MPEPHAGIIIGLKEALLAMAGLVTSAFVGWKMFFTQKMKQIESHSFDIKALDVRVDDLEKDRVRKHDLDTMQEKIITKLDNHNSSIHARIDDLYREMPKRGND